MAMVMHGKTVERHHHQVRKKSFLHQMPPLFGQSFQHHIVELCFHPLEQNRPVKVILVGCRYGPDHVVGETTVFGRDVTPVGEMTVSSTLILFEYRKERQRSFAANVVHRLRVEGGAWKICHKRVDLINSASELDGIAFFF